MRCFLLSFCFATARKANGATIQLHHFGLIDVCKIFLNFIKDVLQVFKAF